MNVVACVTRVQARLVKIELSHLVDQLFGSLNIQLRNGSHYFFSNSTHLPACHFTRVHDLIPHLCSFALSFVSFQSSRLSLRSHDHQALTSSLFSFHRHYAYKSVPSILARLPAVTAININVVARRKNDFQGPPPIRLFC